MNFGFSKQQTSQPNNKLLDNLTSLCNYHFLQTAVGRETFTDLDGEFSFESFDELEISARGRRMAFEEEVD
jgi:hypothetical protein